MKLPDLPPELSYLTHTYDFREVGDGHSAATVYSLESSGRPRLFLKTTSPAGSDVLHAEAERLCWLQERIPVPEPLDFVEAARGAYLLTSAVPGDVLTAFNDADDKVKRRMTVLFAEGLRMLHETDTTDCPFVHSIEEDISNIESSASARSAGNRADLLFELRTAVPPADERVLTHGDPCLPNVLVLGEAVSGFVDLGDAAIGDPYRDLALALWSLDYNYGAKWEESFLDAYGINDVDREKLRYFQNLHSLR